MCSSGRVDRRWLQGALAGGVAGMAAFVALKRALRCKRRRSAARAAKALQAVDGGGAAGLSMGMATGGAGSRDVAAGAERQIRTPYLRLDSGGNAGRTPGAPRYERLDSGKSAGGGVAFILTGFQTLIRTPSETQL